MKEVFCRKCNAKFDEKSLSSFRLCITCDEVITSEINTLSKTKRIIGVITGIVVLLLIPMVIYPLLIGPNASGKYIMKGSRGSRDLAVTFGEILGGGIVILIVALGFLAVYLYLRQKMFKKDAESYPIEICSGDTN